MKHMVMIDESEYKEIVSALRRLRHAVNSLEYNYMVGELDIQLERIETIFKEENK